MNGAALVAEIPAFATRLASPNVTAISVAKVGAITGIFAASEGRLRRRAGAGQRCRTAAFREAVRMQVHVHVSKLAKGSRGGGS